MVVKISGRSWSQLQLGIYPASFKVKTRQELAQKTKGGFAEFCLEIGELLELEGKWNRNISETNAVTLKKGKLKASCQFTTAVLWFKALTSKTDSENVTSCAPFWTLIQGMMLSVGERQDSLVSVWHQNQDLLFQTGEGSQRAVRGARRCFLGYIPKPGFLLPSPRGVVPLLQTWTQLLAEFPAVISSRFPTQKHSSLTVMHQDPKKGLYGNARINPSMSAGSEKVTAQISKCG